jgi:hypothetical protein
MHLVNNKFKVISQRCLKMNPILNVFNVKKKVNNGLIDHILYFYVLIAQQLIKKWNGPLMSKVLV